MTPDDYREVARAHLRDCAEVVGCLAAILLIDGVVLVLLGFDAVVPWLAVPFAVIAFVRVALCAFAVMDLRARAREFERVGRRP